MTLPAPGDEFPAISLDLPGGSTVHRLVPDDVVGLIRYAREHAG